MVCKQGFHIYIVYWLYLLHHQTETFQKPLLFLAIYSLPTCNNFGLLLCLNPMPLCWIKICLHFFCSIWDILDVNTLLLHIYNVLFITLIFKCTYLYIIFLLTFNFQECFRSIPISLCFIQCKRPSSCLYSTSLSYILNPLSLSLSTKFGMPELFHTTFPFLCTEKTTILFISFTPSTFTFYIYYCLNFPPVYFSPLKWNMRIHWFPLEATNYHLLILPVLKITRESLLLHHALWIHIIYFTPTNALLYCNSLKSLH